MACSDNVVRAGLTPKFKDVDCLLSMLQYEPRTSNRIIFPSKICPVHVPDPKLDLNPNSAPEVSVYEPPVQEFAVDRIWVSCCGHMGFLVVCTVTAVLNLLLVKHFTLTQVMAHFFLNINVHCGKCLLVEKTSVPLHSLNHFV